MDKKAFFSRLFEKKIDINNPDFWIFLYAEVQHRLKQIEDLNCHCHFCNNEQFQLNRILSWIIKDSHVKENPKPTNFAGIGYCKKIRQEEDNKERNKLSH